MNHFPVRIHRLLSRCILVGMLFAGMTIPVMAQALEEPENSKVDSQKTQQLESREKQEKQAEEYERKKAVTTGFAMLFLLVFLAAGVVVGIMFWGARMRRIARTKVKNRGPDDPLWYLKPEKKLRTADKKSPSSENDENKSASDQ